MPRGAVVTTVLPFLPALAGLALSVRCFRAHEPMAGLACAYGGVLLMAVIALLATGTSPRRGGGDA